MSSTIDYIEYVCEQIDKRYAVRYRKMFGDYMIYVNEKPVLLVCNNCVYVKRAEELIDSMGNAEFGIPYNGAKEHYILDVENIDLVNTVIETLERITPLPKKRKKSSK